MTKLTQKLSLALLIALYLMAGINHFISPQFYYPLIPDYFEHKILINQLSGIAEILLAIGLIFKPTRYYAAIGIVLLLLAFVPAHIWMITKGGCFTPQSFCLPVWLMWVRLLILQPLLIAWAMYVARFSKLQHKKLL